jgi:S-formylglutathione hydrolase FrmB
MILVATCTAQVQRKAAPHSNMMPESCVRVQDGAFHSAALDREMKYRVLLPCFYQAGGRRFPVLYLLHGLYGDYLNCDTRTNLESYAEKYELIVVMPDAGDSWYTNSATETKGQVRRLYCQRPGGRN